MSDPTVLRRLDYTPPAYLVDEVFLHVALAVEPRTVVRARLRLRRNPAIADGAAPAASLRLDGVGLETRRVCVDGRALAADQYALAADHLELRDPPAAFELETEVVIDPEHNTALEGLYATKGGYLTQCEAQGFRKITWYPDRPDVLARFTTEIEADPHRFPVLLANGNFVSTETLADGRQRVRFVDPFPKPCYLFALVAGDFAAIEDRFETRSGRSVLLKIYAEARNIDKCGHAMRSLQRAMRWDEEAFGLECDLDDYAVVVTDDFNMGAMENKGLNVFNSQYVLASPATATDDDYAAVEGVIGHEYFHNWTGNRITCRDWFQLSLKEGLTVFRDQQFSAAMGSPAVKRIDDVRRLRAAQFPEDAGPLAHPVRPDEVVEINNFYTATVYEKGAEVVRMLHTMLGADAFRAGMDLYVQRHDGQAVTCDDFRAAMADASGRDLMQFGRWYSQAGTPTLDVRGVHDAASSTYTLHVEQRTSPTAGQPEKLPLHLPLAVGLLDDRGRELPLRLRGDDGSVDGRTTRVLEVTQARQTFVFEQVAAPPIPSLLRGFSAPVQLRFPYDRGQLAFLFAHDPDSFNRWDAGQKLALEVMLELVAQARGGGDLVVEPRLVEACCALIAAAAHGPADRALIAEALLFPGEAMVGDAMAVVDVDGIHAARELVRKTIGAAARADLLTLHARLRDEAPAEYGLEAADLQRRRLMHVSLSYLTALRDADALERAERQFATARNMTDSLSALTLLTHAQAPGRDAALGAFYARWRSEPLVVDKWLRVQASAPDVDVLTRVRALLAHEAFVLTNPNKVRALIGAFAGNQVRFHASDGAGYEFVASSILELDPINPQVAARITAAAFGRWRRFDAPRQARQRAQLERIAAKPGLSRDVTEIARRTLA